MEKFIDWYREISDKYVKYLEEKKALGEREDSISPENSGFPNCKDVKEMHKIQLEIEEDFLKAEKDLKDHIKKYKSSMYRNTVMDDVLKLLEKDMENE